MKLFAYLFILVLLMNTVSAFDLAVDNIKEVSPDKTIITYVDTAFFGEDTILAEFKLKTPHFNPVGLGYQKVFEYELTNSYEAVDEMIGDMDFYNIKDSMKPISINVDLKYKVITNDKGIENVCWIDDKTSKTICGDKNYDRNITTYVDYNYKTIIKGETITLSGWTNVKQGDNIEWIPTFYDDKLRVEEWATWVGNLSVSVEYYYALEDDDSNTVVTDSTGNWTNSSLANTDTYTTTGVINKGFNFDGVDDGFQVGTVAFTGQDYSFSMWLKQGTGGEACQRIIDTEGNDLIITPMCSDTSNGFGFYDGSWRDFGVAPVRDVWTHVVYVFDTGTSKGYLYINGTLQVTQPAYAGKDLDGIMRVGIEATVLGSDYNGSIDELMFATRVFTQADVNALYNDGIGCGFGDESCFDLPPPTIILISPNNAITTKEVNINFSCNATDESAILNVSLYIDDVIEQTNTSGINGTYNWEVIGITEGIHTWNCGAFDDDDNQNNGTQRTFTIDTTPFIEFLTPPTLPNYANITQEYIPMKVNVSTNFYKNISFYLQNINGTFFTQEYSTQTFDINFTDIPDGHYHYNVTVCTTTNKCNTTETRHINHDTLPPIIDAIYPNENINYHLNNTILIFNYTINDTHLDSCWINFEGNNNSVNCTLGKHNFTINNPDSLTATLWANDTFGNIASDDYNWNYKLYELDSTFLTPLVEGTIATFLLETKIGSGFIINNVIFNHNGINYPGESFISGTNNILRIADFIIPSVDTNTNVSFSWIVEINDGTFINTSINNQTILNLGIDNCSSFSETRFNFTLLDEELQTSIVTGARIETAFNIYSSDKSVLITNFSQGVNANNLTICLNINITNGSSFILDAVVKYEATGYAIEYYNLFNSTLDNSTISKDIILYDLNNSDSTDFQLTFTGADFVVVEDALVSVQRQYIAENIFKTVELPKTDANGQTILHLVRNDVIYNLIITKNNVVLGTFQNINAFCEDFTIGDCKLNLNAFDTSDEVFNYNESIGLIFTHPDYNSTTRIVSFNFVTDDGTSSNVLMNVTRNDIFGNRSVCETSVESSGGTLTCSVPANIDDSTLIIQIFVNGDLVLKDYSILPSTGYGTGGYLVAFMMVLMFMLMFTSDKSILVMGIVLGFIVSLLLGLIQGQVFGLGSAGMWLIVISIIIIWKLNKNREN